MSNSLDVPLTAIPQLEHSVLFTNEYTIYHLGKSLFDLKEYHRAAHTLRNCMSNEAIFLRLYSLYLVSSHHSSGTASILAVLLWVQGHKFSELYAWAGNNIHSQFWSETIQWCFHIWIIMIFRPAVSDILGTTDLYHICIHAWYMTEVFQYHISM